MQYFPPALEQLVEQFAKLPGVGVKSAQRLAFHLLAQPEEEAAQFAQAILAAKRSIHCCPRGRRPLPYLCQQPPGFLPYLRGGRPQGRGRAGAQPGV